MHAKTAAILGWFAGSYALLLVLGDTSAWLAVALTMSVALATAGIGFSVMHDANHGAYARSASVNRAWGFALDLVGASSYLWRFKHNVHHHTYANIDGMETQTSTPGRSSGSRGRSGSGRSTATSTSTPGCSTASSR